MSKKFVNSLLVRSPPPLTLDLSKQSITGIPMTDVVTVVKATAKMDGTESVTTQISMMAAHLGIQDYGLLMTSIEQDLKGKPAYIVSYWDIGSEGKSRKLNKGERFVEIPKVLFDALKSTTSTTPTNN